MGEPFSLRCLSPLCSAAAWVGAGLKLRELGCFTDSCLLLLGLRSTEFRFLLSVHSEEIHNSPKTGASRGTCRATAVCARLLQGTRPTREPRGPLPSGGKIPASLLSLEHPARLCRAVRGQGVLPLARAVAPVVPRRSVRDCYREPDQPASREARRRAAVKPRPACFPLSTLRGCAAQSGVKGGERKTQGGLSMGQPGLPLAD